MYIIKIGLFVCELVILSGAGFKVFADDTKPVLITIQNHHFTPAEVHIPANKAAVLLIRNLDATAEEFESGALQIEKVIAGKGEGLVHLRATEHGHYTFVGEYHEKVARGVLVVD
jgi:hypothetical protein